MKPTVEELTPIEGRRLSNILSGYRSPKRDSHVTNPETPTPFRTIFSDSNKLKMT